MSRHGQKISEIKFIGTIHPKSVEYFESTTGTYTKSGTK